MEIFEVLIGRIMPFVTIAVLVLGLVWRIRKWQRAAVANVALFPSSKNKSELYKKVLGEVQFFSSFRKENRELWYKTWTLHIALVLILAGHMRLFFAWTDSILGLAMTKESINSLSAYAGGILGIVALVACILLLNRRFTLPRVKEVSTGEDYYVLILVLFILFTGNGLRFFTHYDVAISREYFGTLFLGGEATKEPLFLMHFFFVQLLLIYLPFGKFLHIPGVFFSKSLITKDY